MEITRAIIHSVQKEKDTHGPESVVIGPRDSLLELGDRVNKLATDILKLYGTLSNGYGVLGDDLAVDRFPQFLTDYSAEDIDFIEFSRRTTVVISEYMSQQRFTTTSYPIFFRYTNLERDWLLVAMLKLKSGVGIDEQTLDLNDSLFFDISNVREAARIDIQKWRGDHQPYLSFIKRGAGADSESSLYFRNALSCKEYTDSKHNTESAIKALDAFCDAEGYEPHNRQAAREQFYEYCKEKKEADQPVNLTSLSARIDDQNPEAFANYVRENEFEVSETFSPNNSSFSRLQRLNKRFGTVSIGFDVADLVSERVYYNEEEGSLVLRNPPADLIQDIMKARGLGAVDDE